jgi:hypothetical protein
MQITDVVKFLVAASFVGRAFITCCLSLSHAVTRLQQQWHKTIPKFGEMSSVHVWISYGSAYEGYSLLEYDAVYSGRDLRKSRKDLHWNVMSHIQGE